jgi:hypothetical protein
MVLTMRLTGLTKIAITRYDQLKKYGTLCVME